MPSSELGVVHVKCLYSGFIRVVYEKVIPVVEIGEITWTFQQCPQPCSQMGDWRRVLLSFVSHLTGDG